MLYRSAGVFGLDGALQVQHFKYVVGNRKVGALLYKVLR